MDVLSGCHRGAEETSSWGKDMGASDRVVTRGTPRTIHEQRSRRTREKLSDAAIDCLVEQGYRGTNFVEVCRRAGLTRGAAHHHYRDLPALLVDAMHRLNERLFEQARPALRDVADTAKRVDAAIEVLWDLFTARDFRAVVEIWVAQSHDAALSRRIRHEMDSYAEHVSTGFARYFPELMSEGASALLVMRFSFLVVLGLGFANATIAPRDQDQERQRMLALLKRVVQREVAELRELARSA
jgi:AcrR family transcriptional regulator